MPVYPIPNDWNGTDWECFIIEWPYSEQWVGILRGLITTPLRGRFWDGKTGSIIAAQGTGQEIEERNPVTVCTEMVIELRRIAVAIENININSNLQVAIQTNIENNINLVATAVSTSLAEQTTFLVAASIANASANASAFAWAEMIAKTTESVTIINNYPNEFRPIDITVDPPPQSPELVGSGISPTLESNVDTEICKRAYWLIRDLKEYFRWGENILGITAATVLAISGFLATASWVAAFKADAAGARFLIPAAIILNVSHELQKLWVEGTNPYPALVLWMDSEYQNLVCEVADAVDKEKTTDEIRQLFFDSMVNFGVPAAYSFVGDLIVNRSSLAALYYVAPDLPSAPAIPAFEPANICTFCLE